MQINLIGAGNVAWTLGPKLKECGHTIGAVYSRTYENARHLAAELSAGAGLPVQAVSDLESLPVSDVYLIMLADNALLSMAHQIVSCCPSALFIHTAGSVPMSVLQQAGAVNTAVIYPMQSMTKGKHVDWERMLFFVEGSNGSSLAMAHDMAMAMSGQVRQLNSDDRCRMHMAAVFANNFTNRMMAVSEQLMNQTGLPFELLHPLLKETFDKAMTLGPSRSQTGPASRHDSRVMQQHMSLLESQPELKEIYRLISQNIENNTSR